MSCFTNRFISSFLYFMTVQGLVAVRSLESRVGRLVNESLRYARILISR